MNEGKTDVADKFDNAELLACKNPGLDFEYS